MSATNKTAKEVIENRYKDVGMTVSEIKDMRAMIEKMPANNKFFDDVWSVLDSAGNLLLKKQADYGPKNISQAPGGPLNGLRVRMFDKISRINNLIDTGATPENESLRDSFMDLLNYSAIAMMILDDTWPKS